MMDSDLRARRLLEGAFFIQSGREPCKFRTLTGKWCCFRQAVSSFTCWGQFPGGEHLIISSNFHFPELEVPPGIRESPCMQCEWNPSGTTGTARELCRYNRVQMRRIMVLAARRTIHALTEHTVRRMGRSRLWFIAAAVAGGAPTWSHLCGRCNSNSDRWHCLCTRANRTEVCTGKHQAATPLRRREHH